MSELVETIKCIRCKKDFERSLKSTNRRLCHDKNCHAKRKTNKDYPSYEINSYIFGIKRYFQNPVYQYFRLFNEESLSGTMRHINLFGRN